MHQEMTKLCLFLLYQKAILLSTGHKPYHQNERQRIQRAGGYLDIDNNVVIEGGQLGGFSFIEGKLTTSRAIGIVLPDFLLSFVCNILHWNWSLYLLCRWFCIQEEQTFASWRTNGDMQSRYSRCKFKETHF